MNKKKQMPKQNQLNISPNDETLALLEALVDRFKSRHRSAKNRNSIAAEVVEQFLPVWAKIMEQRDSNLQSSIDEILGKERAASQTPTRRQGRA
jgi:hypothetical protein